MFPGYGLDKFSLTSKDSSAINTLSIDVPEGSIDIGVGFITSQFRCKLFSPNSVVFKTFEPSS